MVPPALEAAQQAALRATVQKTPATAGIELANWNWKVVRQFLSEHFGISLSRSRCLNYLHRLGFVLRRPKKRLVKADEAKREAFVAEYAALSDEARRFGAKIFFAHEAHFRADAELRGKWVLRGEPALTDSGSPRYGEKASYYSAVCLETGEVEWMGLEGNSNSETSAAFFKQEKVRNFLAALACRKEEVKRRCRTVLQSRAEGLLRNPHPDSHHQPNAHPTLALV